jgi:hypothetical protein
MNRKNQIMNRFLALLVLLIIPCMLSAQGIPAELSSSLFEQAVVKFEANTQFEQIFPPLNLVKTSETISNLYDDEMQHGPGPYWLLHSEGIPIVHLEKTEIQKSSQEKLTAIGPNPDRTKWLGYYYDGNYAIFVSSGEIVAVLPQVNRENTSLISWKWRSCDTLIGVASEYFPAMLMPNRYLETDAYPDKVFFFLYRFNDAENQMYTLILPQTTPKTIIRLNGITKDGALVLSEVMQKEYYDDTQGKILGVFDIILEGIISKHKTAVPD